MKYIVFDIETQNTFYDTGDRRPESLDISVVCTYDSHTDKYQSFVEEEFEDLFNIIRQAPVLIGYNSDHFDVPLLNKYYPEDLTVIPSIDLMKTISNALGRRIGLDNVAQATLGVGKSADGLQAIKWWHDGEVDKVKEYCRQDVKVTKDLFEHMRKNKQIKYKDRMGNIVDLPIDTSDWNLEGDVPSATQTLF